MWASAPTVERVSRDAPVIPSVVEGSSQVFSALQCVSAKILRVASLPQDDNTAAKCGVRNVLGLEKCRQVSQGRQGNAPKAPFLRAKCRATPGCAMYGPAGPVCKGGWHAKHDWGIVCWFLLRSKGNPSVSPSASQFVATNSRRGSDGPPDRHSLPRLRFAYPLHKAAPAGACKAQPPKAALSAALRLLILPGTEKVLSRPSSVM